MKQNNGLILMFILVIGTGIYFHFYQNTTLNNPNANPREVSKREDPLYNEEQQNINIFRNTVNSVVFITSIVRQMDWFNQYEVPSGSGSGFIWDNEGRIVTNYHVIAGSHALKVTTHNGKTYNAQVVGVAPNYDLAVIQIAEKASKLPPITLGESSTLQVGQKVLAIGNPFGLDYTLTTGIVSALGRDIKGNNGQTLNDAIQTDAAINPGNSGGPLLDSAGRLIGVNTAIISPSGSYAGIGFAVPVDTINLVIPQLIRHGKIIRPGLGVQCLSAGETSRFIARAYGTKVDGLLIRKVIPKSAATKANPPLKGFRYDSNGNILLGDIILKIENTPINSMETLQYVMKKHKVGDQVVVEFLRNFKPLKTTVTLEGIN